MKSNDIVVGGDYMIQLGDSGVTPGKVLNGPLQDVSTNHNIRWRVALRGQSGEEYIVSSRRIIRTLDQQALEDAQGRKTSEVKRVKLKMDLFCARVLDISLAAWRALYRRAIANHLTIDTRMHPDSIAVKVKGSGFRVESITLSGEAARRFLAGAGIEHHRYSIGAGHSELIPDDLAEAHELGDRFIRRAGFWFQNRRTSSDEYTVYRESVIPFELIDNPEFFDLDSDAGIAVVNPDFVNCYRELQAQWRELSERVVAG